ncbi:hypothetical protein QJQ45_004544 [Haematococcus lacustris]|nr:hypothetical protein QJQ45_004544 [Haematococcus lacustris]
MAFSFAPATSTPAFSFSSAPATGSTAFPAFGASQPATASAGLFGQTAPAAFGTPAQPAAQPLFGITTTPAPAASNTLALWGAQPQQQLQQQQQQQATPLLYSSKFDDLPANIQKELQDIQQEISRYTSDCDKLDHEPLLRDKDALRKLADPPAIALQQGLQGLVEASRSEDDALTYFREVTQFELADLLDAGPGIIVVGLLHSTERAVRTFQRSKLWRDVPTQYRGQQIPPQVQEMLSAPVQLPSAFLEAAVQGFAETLTTYRQKVGELEAMLLPGAAQAQLGGAGGEVGVVQALPTIVSHLHDYFVHVAAQLEQLHGQVDQAKMAFMAQRQAAGDFSDPFCNSRRMLTAGLGGSGLPGHSGVAQPGLPLLLEAPGQTAVQAQPGHQIHAGSPHGPGAPPSPGAFGTPLPSLFGTGVTPADSNKRSGTKAPTAPTQPAASEPGPSTLPPAKHSKRTKAEPEAAEPTQSTKAAKAKPAPQPGRWLDRDCNAALNMQRIGESR